MGQQPTKAESYRHAASALTSDQLLIIKKQFSHLVQRRPPPHRAGFVCGGDSRAYAGPLARPPPPGGGGWGAVPRMHAHTLSICFSHSP